MIPDSTTIPARLPTPGTQAGGEVASAAAASPAGLADPTTLAGLGACVDDARRAALSRSSGPPDPTTFAALRSRLARAAARLPSAWRDAVSSPLLSALDELGTRGFGRVLAEDPAREGRARLLLDLAQAVLQRGEGYEARATAAFEEVVSDLYEGFLSAEDRRGVKPPDHGVAAPLVRWGSAEAGPYTWPALAAEELGVQAAVVSLPAGNARSGLLAWPALAHETAGHDVLMADDGLRDELARAVRSRLLEARMSPAVADYWARRIDESAADVLGVLNMGPAAAVGMIGYFRALNGAWRGTPTLRNVGRPEDAHPADIARAWLSAETVRLLSFREAGRWADRLSAEADRDLGQVRLGNLPVTAEVARESAAVVARTIARVPMRSLEGRALGDIQDWRDADEAAVADLRGRPAGGGGRGPATHVRGTFAAHAVAAAVYDAVSGAVTPAAAMRRMTTTLGAMARANPGWKAGAVAA